MKCKVCNEEKPLTIDYFEQGKNKRNGIEHFYWYKTCKDCDRPRILRKINRYKNKNRKKLAAKQREYHELHKNNDSLTKKIWYLNNKDHVKLKAKIWISNQRKTNITFKLKGNVSANISFHINKNNESCLKYLPYSIKDLKIHLEKQFESWMTWDNYGVYRIDTWNDNDQSTWTWQIDHIIPHSKFNYTSMQDQEFKDCWALSNLQPLSSKHNLLKGNK